MNNWSHIATISAHSFSYALLSSLWQAALIFGLLFVALRMFSSMNARVKHFLAYSACMTVFAWFVSTWQSRYALLKGVTVYITGGTGDASFSTPGTTGDITTVTSSGAGFAQLGQYVPLIITIYCVGLAFMLVRFLINVRQLQLLRRNVAEVHGLAWHRFVNDWTQRFGISRKVSLFLSQKTDVPLMLGVFKPMILLPLATINNLSTEQVEAIILHELAHIKRHDYLLNMLQTVVETILFFNPFVWLISSVIRKEREHCCDDLVVASSSDAVVYANALALLEDNRIAHTLSLAATGNKNQLLNRIKRIIEMKNKNNSHNRLSVFVVAIVAATFLTAMIVFTPTFAQKAKTEKVTEKKKEKKQVTTTKTVTTDDRGTKKVVSKTIVRGDDAADKEDESVDISISLTDDDDQPRAKVIVKAISDEGDARGKKKMKREVIVSSADSKGTRASVHGNVDKEIARIQEELKEIQWDEIGDQLGQEVVAAITEVVQELDMEDIGHRINVEIKKELAESKRDLAEAKRDIAEAKRDMAKARVEAMSHSHGHHSNDMEKMLDEMERDGLIDRDHKFKVEKEDGQLFINGKKQPSKVYDRYRKYLSADNIAISGKKGSLSISISDEDE